MSNNIAKITGKPIPGDLVIASFKNIEFTDDPIADVAGEEQQGRRRRSRASPSADSLKGIYDLTFLNKALEAAKEPTVKVPKL